MSTYRSISNDFLLVSVDIGTYMRLDLLLGSAKGCPGSTCISLCGWKGVKLSLSALSGAPEYPRVSCHVRARRRGGLKCGGGLAPLAAEAVSGGSVSIKRVMQK